MPAFRSLSQLPPEAVDALLARAAPQTWEPSTAVMRQGDSGRWILFVLEGTAHAEVEEPGGGRAVVGRFEPGEVVGEMALLTRQPRTAHVVADSRLSGLVVEAADFDEAAAEFPELGGILTNVVAERLGAGDVDGLSGKIVDRYRIRRCVGRGGMAIVYEAHDVETGERVALKMMSHRLMFEPTALKRFQRESELTEGISHANVARVHRRFRAFRTHFLAMEFCEGVALDACLAARGPLDEAAARAIAGQLGAALAVLHAHGIVHRDLKPSNVIVGPDGVLKLTDFGLAKSVLSDPITNVTQGGWTLGTPHYMPPEAFAGVDPGSGADVYALGCIVLEALLGRPLFREASISELVAAKRSFEIPPAWRVSAGVPDELREFLASALARDPAHRNWDLGRLAGWHAPLL